ncbi:hypothetical protein ILUMI_24729 [Ignelater luminosus]|uniref:Uncharacterized protein n=1 Tax=Ignelater luminosus TaxID=2038154 RepID=A0A8K0G0L7_IGNLU|nr:hypothetical protein ILUMI_24729 [Ignelater luminosus]
MEEMIDMMKELMREIKEIRNDQAKYLKEVKQIREEQAECKDFPEYAEAETVQKFLEEKIGVKTKLNEIQHVGVGKEGRKTVRATVENMESKRLIMKNKKKLKESEYNIDDLTDAEQKIEKKLREIGKIEEKESP